MAIDMGLSRKRNDKRLKVASGLVGLGDRPVDSSDHTFNADARALASRRTWLVCYFLACQ